MKKHLIFLFLLAVTSLTASISHAKDKVYTIGIVPQFEIRHIRKIWNPILSEIHKATGIRIKLRGSPTIPDFEKEMKAGVFDFAYMNPYHMLLAARHQSYMPLVRDNGRQLTGILVVRKDSGIESIEQLNNKKLAFPAPNALGASLFMRALLKNKHGIDFNPVYVKTHSSVYLNVIVRQVSAGGGVQKTLNQQKPNIKNNLRVLYRTPGVTPHPVAVHPRVPVEDREKVMDALLQLGNNQTGKALLAKIPIKQIGSASMQDYTPLEQYQLDQFYVE